MPNNEIEKDILSSIENGGNSPKDIHSKMKQKKHNPDLIREAIHHLREQGKITVDCSLKITKKG